ncbi:hypothetical protein ACU4GD_45960 [Cupriavidus basilensis]
MRERRTSPILTSTLATIGINRGESIVVLDGTPASGPPPALARRSSARCACRGCRSHRPRRVSPEELQRVKAQVVAAQICKRDSVFGRGMKCARGRDFRHFLAQARPHAGEDREVTPAQVQAVAGKYFNDDNPTVATLLPQPIDPTSQGTG